MPADERRKIVSEVGAYYSRSFASFGATAQGVDWNGIESQATRFEQLVELFPKNSPFSLNDLGCGYGAFHEFLCGHFPTHQYSGYDLVPEMIADARVRYSGTDVRFEVGSKLSTPADYSVASGIFNVKGATADSTWLEYVLDTLLHMRACSKKGLAFNLLTSFSDAQFKREDLYYADPLEITGFCLRNFGRSVTLRHGYGLYEFTILVDLQGIPPIESSSE